MSKRIDALLSATGISRKEARLLIQSGLVTVNGKAEKKPETKISDCDVVELNGRVIETEQYIYLLLYKPAGYISTTEETEDSVMKLIPPEFKKKGLAPVGRLDKDSEGLLLLSNDGEYIHRIISPKSYIKKEYYIETENPITQEDIRAFSDGIILANGEKCLSAELYISSPLFEGSKNASRVIIVEGKYHQVKRMIASRNNKVTRLIRLRIGNYSLEGMKEKEIKRIYPDTQKKQI